MWPHFVNLLSRSWDSVLTALSTSTLAVILFSLAAPIATFIVTIIVVTKRRPEQDFMAHLKESFLPTLIGFAVPLAMIGGVFGWRVIVTVYTDHQSLVADIQRLRSAPKPTCPSCPTVPEAKPCPAQKPCPPPAASISAVRGGIQDKLNDLMKKGNAIKSEWIKHLGTSREVQQFYADEVISWQREVESYLHTIPRGDIYVTRLDSATRDSAAYPTGMNMDIGGNWDRLLVDLQSLGQFITDPDLGSGPATPAGPVPSTPVIKAFPENLGPDKDGLVLTQFILTCDCNIPPPLVIELDFDAPIYSLGTIPLPTPKALMGGGERWNGTHGFATIPNTGINSNLSWKVVVKSKDGVNLVSPPRPRAGY